MPSNSEMYERGALDAEHDELNPFYYQHYYYYRMGYDQTRRRVRAGGRRRAPLLMIGLLLVLGLGSLSWWLWARPTTTAAPATVVDLPTPEPTLPTPTLRPTPRPAIVVPTAIPVPSLAPGAAALVANLNGAPLRARSRPGLTSPVVARIPEGSQVTLLEGPTSADGYTWWRVETPAATGWVAEGSPEGIRFLLPAP
ncbi:MAG: SH3 domain-containing protein [Oscillochloridaceae bacterium umkhey_bin13]